jgi:hypothetical protein
MPVSLFLLRCNPGPRRVDRGLGNIRSAAQDFPVFAKHLPLTKFIHKSRFLQTFNLLFFNNLERAFLANRGEGGTPSCPLVSTSSYVQTTRQNPFLEDPFVRS